MRVSYPEIRRRCLKPDEAEKPLYPRVVTHWISTRLVWLFQDLKLSPNQITFLSLIAGFLALPFFASLNPRTAIVGALLIELYYVFDATDGQWARFKGMKSLSGAFFDYLVNYALQAPLLFAIGWGVYGFTFDETFLLLGFAAGMSTLWIILIWNLRASVILAALAFRGKAPAKEKPGHSGAVAAKESPIRWAFGWLHKSMVFPWFMYGLTVTSILSFCLGEEFLANAFIAYLWFYGILGPLVAIALTAQWILARRIDSAPELGE